MARARAHTRCLPPLRVPIKHFTDSTLSPPSCLALWPASLTAEQACFYKAAVKRGESRYGRSCGLFRRSKILHRSVCSALWLGGLRCQCRRQTNGPLTARCPCVMVLGKKKKKDSVGPFSASAHRENTRYARLPVQPCCQATGNSPGSPDGQSAPAKEYEWPTLEKIHTHKSRPIHTRKMICTFTVHDTLVNFKH